MKFLAAVILVFLSWSIAGCQVVPHTVGQLQKAIDQPMPSCVKEQCEIYKDGSIQCWNRMPFGQRSGQGSDCKEEYFKWKAKIAEYQTALELRYNLDAASAPSCVRELHVSPAIAADLRVDLRASDAAAQMLVRSYRGAAATPECAAAICIWLKRVQPDQDSVYCSGSLSYKTNDRKMRAH